MITLLRTNSEHPDFRTLVTLLDRELHQRDGEEHAFYAQFNTIDAIAHVIVAYAEDKAIGCGAIKFFAEDTTEVKRMFVHADYRSRGVASLVLKELETWAQELRFMVCVLETGKRQPEAIRLYEKNGYVPTPNYGQYIGVENSVCFRKEIQ